MTCLKQGIKAVKLTSVMRTFPDEVSFSHGSKPIIVLSTSSLVSMQYLLFFHSFQSISYYLGILASLMRRWTPKSWKLQLASGYLA